MPGESARQCTLGIARQIVRGVVAGSAFQNILVLHAMSQTGV